MLRFVPDTWLDLLLRPLLLVDPVAGLYTEIQAPDWRYLAVVLLLPAVAVSARGRLLLRQTSGRVMLGLTLAFYTWTAVSGNGRYFIWGLLLIGPLAVALARALPATRSARNTVIVGLLALQGFSVWLTFEPNAWMLRPWGRADSPQIAAGALTQQPAVFITVGSISHSILVPLFHPESRWSNVGGQMDLRAGTREYAKLQLLLDAPLPHYGVIRATRLVMTDQQQPTEHAWAIIKRSFARYAVAPTERPCTFAPAHLGGLPYDLKTTQENESGFWFCEIRRTRDNVVDSEDMRVAPELDDVFAQVEARCPRYFPPGNAVTRRMDEGVVRHYSHSDTSVSINDAGAVYFKNMRALNPTEIGPVAAVRAGRFNLDCQRLPGHYAPPWARP